MNIFYIILITLVVYSLISTIMYIIVREDDVVLVVFGLGIVGLLFFAVIGIIQKIVKLFKYHINKRSIFEEESSGNKYKCKTSYTNDIRLVPGYKLIKRYVSKSECIDIPDFSKEFVENSKKNCDHCKYDKECECEYPYTKVRCKHDGYGTVLEFDKFVKK